MPVLIRLQRMVESSAWLKAASGQARRGRRSGSKREFRLVLERGCRESRCMDAAKTGHIIRCLVPSWTKKHSAGRLSEDASPDGRHQLSAFRRSVDLSRGREGMEMQWQRRV